MKDWQKQYGVLVAKHKLSAAKKKKLYDMLKSQAEIKKSLEESEGKKVFLVTNLRYISRWDDFRETDQFDIYSARFFKIRDELDLNKSFLHTKNLPIRLTYTNKVFKSPNSKIFKDWPTLQHEIFGMILA